MNITQLGFSIGVQNVKNRSKTRSYIHLRKKFILASIPNQIKANMKLFFFN